ncbi:MAG: hypothetical protein JO148_04640, partial [Acidimicrobiia bacterium]|nr:hypothetical protein [Acidimicrobiia bacterium]
MSTLPVFVGDIPARDLEWNLVVAHAPQLAATAWRYLDQVALSMRPSSVEVADNTLRGFGGYLVDH